MNRFVHVYDADREAYRLAEVQCIFRRYFGVGKDAYAAEIPNLLTGTRSSAIARSS